MANKSENKQKYELNVGGGEHDRIQDIIRERSCTYRGARELGIDVVYYRIGADLSKPNSIVTLARVPTLEKDLPF